MNSKINSILLVAGLLIATGSGASAGNLSDNDFKMGKRLVLKSPRRAITYLSRSIKLNPKYARAYLERGKAFLELEKYDQAMLDFDKAMQLNNKLAGAHYYRGRLYFEKGEKMSAIADFKKYISLAKSAQSKSVGHRNLAKVYYDMKRYDDAVASLTKAIKYVSKDSSNYWNRGYAYYKQGKFQLAVDDYTRAIEIKDTDDIDKYYSSRAKAYEKLGNDKLAKKDWDFVNKRVKDGWGAFFDDTGKK